MFSLRLFFVISVSIFLISLIAYVRVNWFISTQSAKKAVPSSKDVITDESERFEVPNTRVSSAPYSKKIHTPTKKGNADNRTKDAQQAQQFEQWVTDLNDVQKSGPSQLTEGQVKSEYEISEVDATEPSERKVRTAEIKRRIEWLSERIQQLEDEERLLPHRDPYGQEPTAQSFEERERDREIDSRRRELRLILAKLGGEKYYLRRELRELQH